MHNGSNNGSNGGGNRKRSPRPTTEDTVPITKIDGEAADLIRDIHRASSDLTKALLAGGLELAEITEHLQSKIAETGLAETGFGNEIASFTARKTNYGLTIIKDAPVDVPPLVTLAIIANIRAVIQHVPEEGPPVIQVRDKGGSAVAGRPSSSNNFAFTTHTDLSYTHARPQFMALQAERNAPEDCGYSVFADVGRAVMQLKPSTLAMLCSESYLFPAPPHFAGNARFVSAAILQRDSEGRGHYYVRFRRDELRATSREAMLAAMEFIAALDSVRIELLLPENAIALVDNWRVLHGRTGYLPNPSSERARVLNRLYIIPIAA